MNHENTDSSHHPICTCFGGFHGFGPERSGKRARLREFLAPAVLRFRHGPGRSSHGFRNQRSDICFDETRRESRWQDRFFGALSGGCSWGRAGCWRLSGSDGTLRYGSGRHDQHRGSSGCAGCLEGARHRPRWKNQRWGRGISIRRLGSRPWLSRFGATLPALKNIRQLQYPMKNTILRTANFALWLVFCLLAGTGLMLQYRLPPGSRGGRGLSVWGFSRHEWGDVHFWAAVAMFALVVLHFILNWNWMRKIAASRKSWQLIAGFAIGFGLIALFLLLPVASGGLDVH